ncbi:hypothetical protein Tco_0085906 [Tanacetum coccineum]
MSPGYGILDFVSLWFLVKCMYRYVVSSLMDTAYRMSEQLWQLQLSFISLNSTRLLRTFLYCSCFSSAPLWLDDSVASPTGIVWLGSLYGSDSDSPDEMTSQCTFPRHQKSYFTIHMHDSFEAPDSSDGPPSQDPYVATVARWRSRVTARIDPMTAPLVEEEIVEPAGEDSPDLPDTRDGIVRTVEDLRS